MDVLDAYISNHLDTFKSELGLENLEKRVASNEELTSDFESKFLDLQASVSANEMALSEVPTQADISSVSQRVEINKDGIEKLTVDPCLTRRGLTRH